MTMDLYGRLKGREAVGTTAFATPGAEVVEIATARVHRDSDVDEPGPAGGRGVSAPLGEIKRLGDLTGLRQTDLIVLHPQLGDALRVWRTRQRA
jgi:hypothetical protein